MWCSSREHHSINNNNNILSFPWIKLELEHFFFGAWQGKRVAVWTALFYTKDQPLDHWVFQPRHDQLWYVLVILLNRFGKLINTLQKWLHFSAFHFPFPNKNFAIRDAELSNLTYKIHSTPTLGSFIVQSPSQCFPTAVNKHLASSPHICQMR